MTALQCSEDAHLLSCPEQLKTGLYIYFENLCKFAVAPLQMLHAGVLLGWLYLLELNAKCQNWRNSCFATSFFDANFPHTPVFLQNIAHVLCWPLAFAKCSIQAGGLVQGLICGKCEQWTLKRPKTKGVVVCCFSVKEETIINVAISFDPFHVFRVDDEASDYQLWVGGYTGNASDSLSAHNGYKFSTVDRNNDEAPKCCPCAPAYGGGWWFYRWLTFHIWSLLTLFSLSQLLRVQPERRVLPGGGGQRLLQGDRLGALAGRLLPQVRRDDGPPQGDP